MNDTLQGAGLVDCFWWTTEVVFVAEKAFMQALEKEIVANNMK